MKELKKIKLSLTAVFCLLVFWILVCTGLIVGLMIYLARRWSVDIPITGFNMFLILAGISVVIGTLLSLILSPRALRPLRQLFAAMEEVAHGNFDVRIHLKGMMEGDVMSENFNAMVKELGSYELLRSDFVNNFSHEFKTPIVSLRGFAKLLKNNTLTESERDEYLDIIIREADRLASLATNTLNLSKVENLEIRPRGTWFDLAEQIRRVVLMLESKWEKKDIEPVVELEEIRFCGNEDLLGQVWINLVDNAIKFSPEHSQIEVSLVQRGDRVLFSIADHGCGMTEEQQKHIFDKFYQADTSRKMEGNGIGLAIVHKVIDLYGGAITCDSVPDGGTTFVVSLPQTADGSETVRAF